jgi:hypothetical protein
VRLHLSKCAPPWGTNTPGIEHFWCLQENLCFCLSRRKKKEKKKEKKSFAYIYV